MLETWVYLLFCSSDFPGGSYPHVVEESEELDVLRSTIARHAVM